METRYSSSWCNSFFSRTSVISPTGKWLYMNVYPKLKIYFPILVEPTRVIREVWASSKNGYRLGEYVSGRVVLEADFGAYFKCGNFQFPFFLLKAKSKDPLLNIPISGVVGGNIYVFNDEVFQVGVTQKGREHWMEGGWH